MEPVCVDLLDEYRELAEFCGTLSDADWSVPSHFYGWTPRDEIAHLAYFDEAAMRAIEDPATFSAGAAVLVRRMQAGDRISAVAREHYAHLDNPALLAHWRTEFATLVQALTDAAPGTRLPWYGPSMSVRSFASARLMEVWAHGQDIWDALGRRRLATPRLRHIAHIGASTFGWTFVNRGLPVPEPVPFVELDSPDGSRWTWGEPSVVDCVQGTAEDFCLVVTQRRNVVDTGLSVRGDSARRWLAIAQCFAGPPADPPPPGLRLNPA